MKTMTRVIIASQSPRRREILLSKYSDLSILEVKGPDEPRWVVGQSPDIYLTECVNFKANLARFAFMQNGQKSDVSSSTFSFVIVADTIVQKDKTVFGKPKDVKDAKYILKKLSHSVHLVKTKVKTLVFDSQNKFVDEFEFTSISEVEFKSLSNLEITKYIQSKEPFDKAGAYGLQDKALRFVKNIKGSYLNIIGFPLNDFVREFEDYQARKNMR